MCHWINQTTVFGLLLLAVAGMAARVAWFGYASLRWPTTPARIDYLGLSRGKQADAYRLIVRYSYMVNGVTFQSTRWRFGPGPSGTMPAITLAASTEIKPTDPVVFYDPAKPGRSCLVAGLDETTLMVPIISFVIGATALVAGIR